MESNYFYQQDFAGETYTDDEFPAGEYEDCSFTDCIWESASLENIQFMDCRFKNCRLSNAKLEESQWQNVEFQDCQLLGLLFSEINPFLFKIQCKGSQIQYGSFFQLDLRACRFASSQILEVDFVESDLREVPFLECDLRGSQFERSNLVETDFRTSKGIRLSLGQNAVKGAKFSLPQLPGLLSEFQLDIEL